jgi:hypothetical protein
MIVFIHGANSRPDVLFQEFTTKERCDVARVQVLGAWEVSNDRRLINAASCIQK